MIDHYSISGRKIPLQWNPDCAEAFLLSKKEEDNVRWYIRTLKADIEKWSFEHNMWGKYHDDFWFQRATGISKETMLENYFRLARLLTFFEPELEAYENILAYHMMAVQTLHESMTGLRKVDLQITELTQKPLFE
jgi:hypothetical protein